MLMNKVLLHACCAPCSSAILEWLLNNGYTPILYFCNPNIYPLEEYEHRKSELISYANKLEVKFIDDDYNHSDWLSCVRGLEAQPERGSRCLECFKYRLLKTAYKALELNIPLFTTTLASSRWKNLTQINEAGKWAENEVREKASSNIFIESPKFWDKNWRKDGLQNRRNELLKQEGFYNQQYCGCEFSMRKEE